MQFWKEMEGKTLAGRYTLGRLLRSADRGAWFTTTDDQQKPWTAFVADAANDDESLLKNLETACRVKHANVVTIEKTGRARIDDKPLVYAILEPTEENLGEILRERALTPDETAQITASIVAGLTAIHEQGMFHGQVNPANVLASGDTVKLSSDCLQKVTPETRADSFAQDTGDLGATVFEALTQRKLTSPEDSAIQKLPVPFRSIVQSSVIGRWGLADIAAALKKPALEELRHPVPNVGPAAKPKFAEDAAAKVVTPRAPKVDPIAQPGKSNKAAVRLVAIVALLAAIGVVWFFFRTQSNSTQTATTGPVAPSQDPATQPSSSPSATPSKTSDNTPPPHAAHIAVPPISRTAETHSGEHKIWRVVVYAFSNESAAQHKVASIAAAHPELKPEVFSAAGHGPWLVTVGGAMDREQAFQLRGEVRNEGLPIDSYAQNYSH